MTSIKDWITAHSNQFNQFNNPIPTADLRTLLAHLLKQDSAWLYVHEEQPLNEPQIDQLSAWFEQLKAGYPLAYIIGKQAFWDLELMVNEHTLIPRADTETLIEVCIELMPKAPSTILDLGTGSGAIALALARVFKKTSILAIDASEQAIQMAQHNAHLCAIEHVKFKVSDWFSAINNQTFDMIVSNPPYIAPGDSHLQALQFEPSSALVAGDAGLEDFKAICKDAMNHLNPSGYLIFEHGWQQKEALQEMMHKAGFTAVHTVQDLAGNDRVTYGTKA